VEGQSPILEKINALTHLIHQFVLVILLVKVNIAFLFLKEKCYITWGGGGEGVREMSPNVTRGEGGLKSVEKVSCII
jgi:hypothetical protein